MKILRIRKNKLFTATSLLIIAGLVLNFSFFPSVVAKAQTYSETTYEAESATLYNVTTNTNHSGYTGTGFVDGFGEVGDYVQFSISIPASEDVTLRFRYSNDTGNTNVREVYVDGTFVSNAYFTNLGSWDTWSTTDVGTTLAAGNHTVKLALNNSTDGYINLDNLVVTPKNEAVRSLYMSNWNNMMAIWQASKLSDNDTVSTKGPRIAELRYSGNWSVNQIQDYSSFYRDATNGVNYDQPHNFDSQAYYDESGVLHTDFLKYNGSYLPGMEISKDYVSVPNQNFIVARYSLKNTGSSNLTYQILDMLHVNNTTTNSISASYDSTRKATVVNMSNSGQPYLAIGAFAAPTYFQAADDSDSTISDAACSPWYTFDHNGTLNDNASVAASNISTAFEQSVTVAAGSTQYVYFYLALGSNLSAVQAACDTARAQTGDYWFANTASSYQNWFSGKTIPSFSDSSLTQVYKRNLVMVKNCIRPGTTTSDGALPATTNPLAYGYKVWSRDSAVTALSLDAAGFTAEAGTYWNWLAARQNSDGTFHTCYDLWDNTNANFVEPEDDAIGIFLIGVYRHYLATGDSTFLSNIYSAVQKSANYIMNNINSTGFGPADKSIWEEGDTSEYYTYTQTAYAMGLKCAAMIAKVEGNASLADSYNGAASTISTAINRDDTSGGLWDAAGGYYDRCVNTDGTVNKMEDTSTDILFVFGDIDALSSRAGSHVSKLENDLAKDVYGLPRYADDTFYYTSQWSPSGNEALEASPSWPQMTMWDSIFQDYDGNSSKAYNMLEWFKDRTGTGYMVTGEAVSDVTETPIVSTASEPVTAASFILASLVYADGYDTRVYASESNASCYTSISVTSGASSDWGEYQYMPYYIDAKGDTTVSDGQTDIEKVYISNDANNIYIRVNNEAGTLPGSSTPAFRISAYTEDFSGSSATTTASVNGTALGRNMAFLFTRANTDSGYSKYTVSNGNWTYNKSITSVIAPQWDPNNGGIEMVIPRSEIGNPANDAWGHITVVLEKYQSGNFIDQDEASFNYRICSGSDSWYYGNFQ